MSRMDAAVYVFVSDNRVSVTRVLVEMCTYSLLQMPETHTTPQKFTPTLTTTECHSRMPQTVYLASDALGAQLSEAIAAHLQEKHSSSLSVQQLGTFDKYYEAAHKVRSSTQHNPW